MMKKITVIIPVMNEEGNIEKLVDELSYSFAVLPYRFSILFVDEGSTDGTPQVLKKVTKTYNNVHYILLSKNFGHQNALKAGIDAAEGDAVIMMDGDMQHPVEVIPQLLQKFEQGFEIVNTIRKDNGDSTGWMKRASSRFFYKQINRLADIKIRSGSADFRLVSRKVLNELKKLHEYDIFYRGLIVWVGFKQTEIEYEPRKRFSGASKYSLSKMIRFSVQGITSFSVKPLHVAVYIGIAVSILSLLYIPYVLYSLFAGIAVSGWASTIVTVAFFGGLQLMVLGIIGIYIGKVFMFTKERPHYIVRETNLQPGRNEETKEPRYSIAEF
ncbi:MAG: glycosyltransferase family 2 protein [Bacteroidota bacterium]|nr:glycosyltransferase family 2 protein [Bacteroidota bacterium]